MLTIAVVLIAIDLVATLCVLALFRGTKSVSKRFRRRDEYGRHAAAYAEQLGGSSAEKLEAALGCFRLLDLADNKKRDFTDAEARLAIEIALQESRK